MHKIRVVAVALALVGGLAVTGPGVANASAAPTPVGSPVTTTTVQRTVVNGQPVTITTTSTVQRLRLPGAHPNTSACGSFPAGQIGYRQGTQTYSWSGGVVTEQQKFQAFFDGCYAWYYPRYGWDTSNYHDCNNGHTNFGYSKTINSCYLRPDTIGAEIGFGDKFTICTVGGGIAFGCSTFTMGDFITKGGDIHG